MLRKKVLRYGYTTGACAAAAAKAAAIALLNRRPVEEVQISLPAGEVANFKIHRCEFNSREACCSVIKDAGDDPDVTDGAEICAAVDWKDAPGVAIEGGNGVGVITKPGFEIPVGKPAINRVPLMMIGNAISEVMGQHLESRGLRVVISVPAGEELTRHTLNRRLGIIGGISILGTTGVVIPYSVDAYKVSISQALDIAVATGCRQVVLTTGRRSEKFAQQEFTFAEECFIQIGDFVGHALEECARRKLEKVTIWGMVGKLSKIASGHLYTNVSDSRVDVNLLVRVAASCGVPQSALSAARKAVNAHHFLSTLGQEDIRKFAGRLCLLAAQDCRRYVNNVFEVECIMSDYHGAILGRANAGG